MSNTLPLRLLVTVGTVHLGVGGGAVFTGQDAEGQRHKFVAGREQITRPPTIGENWDVEGSPYQHPRYGAQVRVAAARLVRPSGRLIVDYLQRHPAFRDTGVGEAKANRLWQTFGLDLYAILHAGDVGTLATVLTEETARRLAAA